MIGFLNEAREKRRALAAELKVMVEQGKNGTRDVLAGMHRATGRTTTGMKIVRESGGNREEHRWVQQQAASARSLHDRAWESGHHYELYRKHEKEPSKLMLWH